MKVTEIHPDSPLFGYVRPGYTLVSVNGEEALDGIDFRFRTTDDKIELVFADPAGETATFRLETVPGDDLGLTLEEPPVKVCKCNCIFCFVQQQPKGMRRSLYVKDEDYRLSFTHGNFVTMSNMSDADLDRIVEQRLSPLYISVHTTDDKLRRCMLRNEKLAPIVPRIKFLTERGITVHTQVVLCPEINDGAALDQTIDQLSELYPGVSNLAVVPVGLTRYRDHLPNLRTYTNDEAGGIINRVEKRQRRFLKTLGSRFVWAADEFYVQAGRAFPSLASYEEMAQFENGVGMAREFITRFNRRRTRLGKLNTRRRALFLTGHSAFSFWTSELQPYLKKQLRLKLEVAPVVNHFWGEKVTVSGLLTGQDLLRTARSQGDAYDVCVLPPNCLNHDDLFLDNLSLEQFRRTLNKDVIVGGYNLPDTIHEVFV
jgi:putative radical SAM enzyme (TIGR03279 family)